MEWWCKAVQGRGKENTNKIINGRGWCLALLITMIVLSWNCWGLRNHHAVEVLSELVKKNAPIILFLMETKLTDREMKLIKTELGFYGLPAVSCNRCRGGLAILWKEEVTVDTNITILMWPYTHRLHLFGDCWGLFFCPTWYYFIGNPCHINILLIF